MQKIPVSILLAITLFLSTLFLGINWALVAIVISGVSLVYLLTMFVIATRSNKKNGNGITERMALNTSLIEGFYQWFESTIMKDVVDVYFSPDAEMTKLILKCRRKDTDKPLTLEVKLLDENVPEKDLHSQAGKLLAYMQETVNMYMNDQLINQKE